MKNPAGYSGSPLVEKLGPKEGMWVRLINPPDQRDELEREAHNDVRCSCRATLPSGFLLARHEQVERVRGFYVRVVCYRPVRDSNRLHVTTWGGLPRIEDRIVGRAKREADAEGATRRTNFRDVVCRGREVEALPTLHRSLRWS